VFGRGKVQAHLSVLSVLDFPGYPFHLPSAFNPAHNQARGLEMTIGALASWRVQDAQKQVARRAKAHSDEIDLRIKEDSKRLQRKCDILLMGSSFLSIQLYVQIVVQGGLFFASYPESVHKYC
jgi:hypothetical protein